MYQPLMMMMIGECGAVEGIRIGRGNLVSFFPSQIFI
jgi:hypothetical protein